jgi:hypothetical protein
MRVAPYVIATAYAMEVTRVYATLEGERQNRSGFAVIEGTRLYACGA